MSLPFFARRASQLEPLVRWLSRLESRQVGLATALAYLVLIALAELITTFAEPRVGLTLHGMLLVMLLLHSALASRHAYHRLLLSLTLAPLIRILSLALPLVGWEMRYWYLIISVPLFVATILLVRILDLSREQLGLAVRKIPLQFLVALTGFSFGMMEYRILKPHSLMISSFESGSVLVSGFILVVCTGFAEELIFRGVIQRTSIQSLGRFGLLYVAVLFAVLHIGYRSVPDVVFVFCVALVFGWVAERTWSLLGVSLAHGITNIMLFMVMPLLEL